MLSMENFTKSANTKSLHKQYTGLCIKTNKKNSTMSKELDQLANLNSLIRAWKENVEIEEMKEEQGRKRNRNEREETEIKTFPLYLYLLQR